MNVLPINFDMKKKQTSFQKRFYVLLVFKMFLGKNYLKNFCTRWKISQKQSLKIKKSVKTH